MTITELAERYGVHVNACFQWRAKGWMPPGFLFRGRRRWFAPDITAWEDAGFHLHW